jgi:hypothetical protein
MFRSGFETNAINSLFINIINWRKWKFIGLVAVLAMHKTSLKQTGKYPLINNHLHQVCSAEIPIFVSFSILQKLLYGPTANKPLKQTIRRT